MLNFKKIAMLSMAAMMAISAMSVSAFAKTEICDDNGEIIGYEYSKDEINMDKVAQIPATISSSTMTSTAPSYSSAVSLNNGDLTQGFSISGLNKYKYSKAWYNTGSELGIFFNTLSQPVNKYKFVVSEISSTNQVTDVKNMTPSSDAAAISFSGLSSSKRYCVKVVNKYSGSTSGTIAITNDIKSYFN